MSKYFLNKEDFDVVVKKQPVMDSQAAEILGALAIASNNSSKSEFAELIERVRKELYRAAKDNGGLQLAQVFAFRKYYLQRELAAAMGAGSTDAPSYILTQQCRVFDACVSRALQNKAGRLTKGKAAEWDDELRDLNALHNTFIMPQQRVGSEYLPCSMEDLAFLEDSFASNNGGWSWAPQADGTQTNSMQEPYANPLDMSAEFH